MDNQVEKNISIMYLRVIATAFIFIDHALAYTDMPGKSIIIQITNSGVLIFLMISGFLYGGKTIGDMVGWLKNRVLRLYIPYFIFIIVYYLCMFVQGKFVLKSFLTYLFMFQGILGTENGPHTLWFMTLLLMCYCLIPLLQFIRKYIDENKIAFNSVYFAVCVLLLFILQIMLAYNCNKTMAVGQYLSW
ncbi:MAG: acyltransferase [Candidatus Gastranaerophilales bacterium]|nr:acyltransferase [Candidatus Gastranaerophilales bacterium]